jgi:hypothetical protein
MEIEIITPAGRKRYLQILYENLKKQKADFNKWVLWINTLNIEDVAFCKELERDNDWITTIDPIVPPSGGWTIYSFFVHAQDPNKIYIRFDDDIVWLEDNFIKKLTSFRLLHPEYFLVYGNIINNSIIDHIHQRQGALQIDKKIHYHVMDPVGWSNPQIAEEKHKNLIKAIQQNDLEKFKFKYWILDIFERVSINCISWFGADFKNFNGEVGHDEEQWLSVEYPIQIQKYNIIYGEALCSHYAFMPQRFYLDTQKNLLQEYRNLAK